MKYIRTKNKVVDYEQAISNIKYWFKNVAFESDEYNIKTEIDQLNKDIIKRADTIEELCDEFVYLMESGKHICKAKHTDVMYCFDEDKPLAYYGAIWTDKGLIYAAKMNEKGELVLL